VHVGDKWFVEHALPQPPQFERSDVVSEHTGGEPQAVSPVGHGHAPFTQAMPTGHTNPHAPQFDESVWRFVSQPSENRSLLQSLKPVTHAPTHDPAVHARTTTLFDEQVRPHPPQLSGSPAVFFSHPSLSLSPLQSVQPGSHTPEQRPSVHVGVAMWMLEHAMPQPAQLLGSDVMFASHPSLRSWLQSKSGGLHVAPHTPKLQTGVAPPHFMPQPPQFAGSVSAFDSQPSVRLSLLQSW
jgi:hypothetical protein